MAPAILALEAAFEFVHSHWGVIGPTVGLIEKELGNVLPGVKKAEIAFAALAPQLKEFESVTPELQAAFNVGVKVLKLGNAAKVALGLAPPAAA